MVTKDFLKAVLKEDKDLLRMNKVAFVNPPAYDETGVKALYEKVLQQPGMAKYFPDKYPKGRQCDRAYMYNVWATIHPEQVSQVIAYANSQRYSITAEKEKQETIILTDKWKAELDAMPFVSKVKGRMSMLLKQKSKVGVLHKSRTTYPAFDFAPRPREA